jgi:hypothetical protein
MLGMEAVAANASTDSPLPLGSAARVRDGGGRSPRCAERAGSLSLREARSSRPYRMNRLRSALAASAPIRSCT